MSKEFSRRNSPFDLKELGKEFKHLWDAPREHTDVELPLQSHFWGKLPSTPWKLGSSPSLVCRAGEGSELCRNTEQKFHILLSLCCLIPVISNMWMNQIIYRAEGVGLRAGLRRQRILASCSPPPFRGGCAVVGLREEASLEMPCREETVPFQCEESKIAANKKPSYCDTSIQTPTRMPWQAVWLLTSLFLLFLQRLPPITHTDAQRCSDREGQQGSASPAAELKRREAGPLKLQVQKPSRHSDLAAYSLPRMVFDKTYLERVRIISSDWRGDPQKILDLLAQKCHSSRNPASAGRRAAGLDFKTVIEIQYAFLWEKTENLLISAIPSLLGK